MPKSKLKSELIKENELLYDRLERLERLLTLDTDKKEESKDDNSMIAMHKIIKVVSLYNGILNLKTSAGDEHAIFKFNFFGDEQPLFYSDLVKAISIQQRFFKDGFCMILDDDVVKAHYLTESYKNLLNKEELDNFLAFSDDEIKEKYPKLTEHQKITVLERVAYKINKRDVLDMNKVDVLSSVSKQNLVDLANKLK
jgi:hypothetical protein